MSFTAKDVMKLREQTGVGMMDCKKALTEADGDMEQAVEILRKKGMATSAKRADKIASQGVVSACIKGNVGVLVEVNCESDFVARGEQFKSFVDKIAEYIVANDVEDVAAVVAANQDLLHETIAKIGEKIADFHAYADVRMMNVHTKSAVRGLEYGAADLGGNFGRGKRESLVRTLGFHLEGSGAVKIRQKRGACRF